MLPLYNRDQDLDIRHRALPRARLFCIVGRGMLMSDVRDQYEVFPYPERNPQDESTRLITGSPSLPIEMDHCLWAGQRDWARPLRVLVAGGGTGDGLIQLAQTMRTANKLCEIVYIDLSEASRKVAEARATARQLDNIRFVTGSLLDAPDFGTFDYIDCCGVLHHLPEPEEGLRALRAALAPGGGLGFMVYAPYGRAGVYPLQAAFNRLYGHLPPRARLKHAKKAFEAVPEGHPLRRNPHLSDHQQSDAGFYDLLVHSQDRAFDVRSWVDALSATGWSLETFAQPGLYDLERLVDVPKNLDHVQQMATAEELRGTIKAHVGYARSADEDAAEWGQLADRVPHLNNVSAKGLAEAVRVNKVPTLRVGSEHVAVTIRADAAPLIAAVDGCRTIDEIAEASGLNNQKAFRIWANIEEALAPWGVLHYSGFLR